MKSFIDPDEIDSWIVDQIDKELQGWRSRKATNMRQGDEFSQNAIMRYLKRCGEELAHSGSMKRLSPMMQAEQSRSIEQH